MNDWLTVGTVNLVFGVASIATQLALAVLYFRAGRRHRHRSFFILLAGALAWAAYIVTAILSTGPNLSSETATNIFRASLLLGFISLALVLAGVMSLLKSYKAMATEKPPHG